MKYNVVVQVVGAFSTKLVINAPDEETAAGLAEEAAIEDPGFGLPGALIWQKDGPAEDVRVEIEKARPKRRRLRG